MNIKPRISWEQYAINLAYAASTRSEDPYRQVGSVCLRRVDNSVASVGYNGAPKGICIDWSNRDERRNKVIHSEVNCLRRTFPAECWLLACTLLPCNNCLKEIAAYGISKVVYGELYELDKSSLELAKEFNIELVNLPIC